MHGPVSYSFCFPYDKSQSCLMYPLEVVPACVCHCVDLTDVSLSITKHAGKFISSN